MNQSRWAIWIEAARPRTLPAALAPVLVGTALAAHEGVVKPIAAALCLLFALLSQIAANFGNDYFDFVKGADNASRVGPRRAVASGLVAPAVMKRATIGVCIAAFCIGLGLLPYGGWPLLAIGIASLASAIAYTGGPYPLGYHGLGDVFVFVFFGLVAVCATVYVQVGNVSMSSILTGAAVGALATNILIVNNYRDADTDRAAGKRTLVVRFGRRFARTHFSANHLLALATPLALAIGQHRSLPAALLLASPFAYWFWRQERSLANSTEPAALIALLGGCGRLLAAYAFCFSLWLLCLP